MLKTQTKNLKLWSEAANQFNQTLHQNLDAVIHNSMSLTKQLDSYGLGLILIGYPWSNYLEYIIAHKNILRDSRLCVQVVDHTKWVFGIDKPELVLSRMLGDRYAQWILDGKTKYLNLYAVGTTDVFNIAAFLESIIGKISNNIEIKLFLVPILLGFRRKLDNGFISSRKIQSDKIALYYQSVRAAKKEVFVLYDTFLEAGWADDYQFFWALFFHLYDLSLQIYLIESTMSLSDKKKEKINFFKKYIFHLHDLLVSLGPNFFMARFLPVLWKIYRFLFDINILINNLEKAIAAIFYRKTESKLSIPANSLGIIAGSPFMIAYPVYIESVWNGLGWLLLDGFKNNVESLEELRNILSGFVDIDAALDIFSLDKKPAIVHSAQIPPESCIKMVYDNSNLKFSTYPKILDWLFYLAQGLSSHTVTS